MKNADVPVFREWVTDNIKQNGDVGGLGACEDVGQSGPVNVLTGWAVAFNFHVNLTGPCQ
jgi:hypothetical protein